MTENNRLKELQGRLGFSSQSDFAKKLGIKQGSLSDIYREKKGVGVSDSIKRILDKEFSINIEWLETGNGNMFKSENVLEKNADFRLVPMYNLDARGGFGGNDEVDVAEYVIDRIPFKDANSDDICVPITGNSMAPTYCAGSIVLLHHVAQWHEFLELGQVYMIVLKDGRRLIKELRASQEDRKSNYLCVSHNPTFDPVELPKDMISRVFLVRAVYAKTAM